MLGVLGKHSHLAFDVVLEQLLIHTHLVVVIHHVGPSRSAGAAFVAACGGGREVQCSHTALVFTWKLKIGRASCRERVSSPV